jgi:hypothetical protein
MSSDPWKRFRERQVEQKPSQSGAGQTTPRRSGPSTSAGLNSGARSPSEELELLARQIEPLLEQLNSLYQMYLQGLEKRPPIEKRALLDRLLVQLNDLSKTNASIRFRSQTLVTSAHTRIELWNRQLKKFETAA